MSEKVLRVLAVADPAVTAYTDKRFGILENYPEKVQFDAVPWERYYSTMMDVFAGKAQYDIVMVAGHLWLCDFVRKGYLAELSYDFEDILPVIAAEMQYEGKTYLSPSFCDGHIVTYRKSALKKVLGRTFDNMITPQEFAEAAYLLAKETGKPAVALKASVAEIFTDALPFLRMNGVDPYCGTKADCNRKEVIEGLEAYCGLKKIALAGCDTFGNDEVAAAIRENKVPLATTWSGQMGVVYTDDCVQKEDIGFAAFTTGWNVSWSFAVSQNSTQKKEAEKFLAFLRSAQVDKIAGDVSGSPVRLCNYKAEDDEHPWYACQLKMFEKAAPLPDMPFAGDKNGIFYQEISNAFTGKKTPAQAMKDAQEAINRIE